ncbi:hypothetical protein [Kitasatospora sp. NPDC056181]|uniref:hypothetical protein n=1 Tax=Kitasatospora sp. NPDC056181 TaxID=3345737 RepID=UPI0035D80C4A
MNRPPLTAEQREQALQQLAEHVAAWQQMATALMPALQAAAEQLAHAFAELQRTLQAAGLLDADGRPVRPVDRPAWQSPYGPPTRR